MSLQRLPAALWRVAVQCVDSFQTVPLFWVCPTQSNLHAGSFFLHDIKLPYRLRWNHDI